MLPHAHEDTHSASLPQKRGIRFSSTGQNNSNVKVMGRTLACQVRGWRKHQGSRGAQSPKLDESRHMLPPRAVVVGRLGHRGVNAMAVF